MGGIDFRGRRFSCTPYYPDAPHPPIPVPPLPVVTLPASFEPPELVTVFKEANPSVPIWQSIQYLDHEAIDLLRQPAGFGAVEKWEAYLGRTGVSSFHTSGRLRRMSVIQLSLEYDLRTKPDHRAAQPDPIRPRT